MFVQWFDRTTRLEVLIYRGGKSPDPSTGNSTLHSYLHLLYFSQRHARKDITRFLSISRLNNRRKTGWKHSFPRSTHISTTVVSASRLKIYSIGHEEARRKSWKGAEVCPTFDTMVGLTLVNQAYRQDPGFLSLGNTKYGLLRGALSLMRNCSWTRFDLRNARRSINYRPVKGVPSLWKWSLIDWYTFLWRKCRIA